MKIRTGFVSNSSSASFVLNTKLGVDDFKKFLVEQAGFNKDRILIILKEEKINYQEIIDSFKNSDESIYIAIKNQHINLIEDIDKILEYINKENDSIKILDKFLAWRRNPVETNWYGFASMSGWTTMWNGEEDMGEPFSSIMQKLKEIYGENSYMVETDD